MRWCLTAWIPMLLVSLAGCDRSAPAPIAVQPVSHASSTAGVAVIDLDAVAKALGRDVQMNNTIQQQQQSLERQLEQYQIELKGRFTQQQGAFGQISAASPDQTEQQQAALRSLDQQLGTELNNALGNARNSLSAQRLQLIQQFRDEVQPIARQVAMERGCNIVVTKNDAVIFAHSPAADISGEVATRMEQPARQAKQ